MDFLERAEKYTSECVNLYNDEGGLKGFKALSQLHREMVYNKEAFQKSLESNKKILLDKILINFTEALVSINNESFESNHSYVLKHSSLEHLKTLIDKYFQDGNIREYEREKILTQIFDEIENQSERLGLNNYRIDLYPTHRLGFSFLSAEKARHRALKLNSYLFASNFVLDKIIDIEFNPILNTSEIVDEFKRSLGRPNDESAPQDKIEEKVIELANTPEFQRNGKPMPTKIRGFIYDNHPELYGDIKEGALFNRVKKALKNNNM